MLYGIDQGLLAPGAAVLDAVEDLYVDLDHPPDLAPFIRYMPSNEPNLGSVAANEARMTARLKSFLALRAPFHSPT